MNRGLTDDDAARLICYKDGVGDDARVGKTHYGCKASSISVRRFSVAKGPVSSNSGENHPQKKSDMKVWEVHNHSSGNQHRQDVILFTTNRIKHTTKEEQSTSNTSDILWNSARVTEEYLLSSSPPPPLIRNILSKQKLHAQQNKDNSSSSLLEHSAILSPLLPAGFPHSVPPFYLTFSAYTFVASVASSAAMVISTQTLLLAAGVLSSTGQASAAAATLNWVVKDGVGQLFGGVLFASRLGRSRGFDLHPKRWRMVSSMSMDAATLLEIAAPSFPPSYFLAIASLANVLKNVSFLSASASRAALHQSMTCGRHGNNNNNNNNLADITAKAGTQAICASLVGTALGIAVSPWIMADLDSSYHVVLAGFIVLSSIHQGGTYLSLRSVAMSSLNRERLDYVLNHYVVKISRISSDCESTEREKNIGDGNSSTSYSNTSTDIASREVLSPFHVAELEHVLFSASSSTPWLVVGCSLDELCPEATDFSNLLLEGEKYVLNYIINEGVATCRLVFMEDADGIDIIRGMLHSHLLHNNETTRIQTVDLACTVNDTHRINMNTDIIHASHKLMISHIASFQKGLQEQGWMTEPNNVNVDECGGHRIVIEQQCESRSLDASS